MFFKMLNIVLIGLFSFLFCVLLEIFEHLIRYVNLNSIVIHCDQLLVKLLFKDHIQVYHRVEGDS